MKKIIVMLFLAVALNAEVKTKESLEDCENYLQQGDKLANTKASDNSWYKLKEDPALTWLKVVANNTSVANLYKRYEICISRAKASE